MCRQVFDALSLALADIDDPLLDDLALVSVVPAPDASRVQVTLVPSTEVDRDAVLARLDAYAKEFREEVAAELTRKRAPELVFVIGHRAPDGI